ncbi:MAG: hypothetical protein AAFR62_01060 [Cyanobacteria bacterium J06629_2]
MESSLVIIFSAILCLTPIALTIHLALKKSESRVYKKKLGYIYGSLWAIAFLGCGWLFMI